MVRNARGQARGRRLVPGRQPRQPGQLADLVLAKAHLVERAPDAELARGLPSRPIVAAVVGVVAVDDDRIRRGSHARQMRVQLVLAEVTAVGGIGPVLGPVHFVRVDNLVPQAEAGGDLARKPTMLARDNWGCRPSRQPRACRECGALRTPDTRCRHRRCTQRRRSRAR